MGKERKIGSCNHNYFIGRKEGFQCLRTGENKWEKQCDEYNVEKSVGPSFQAEDMSVPTQTINYRRFSHEAEDFSRSQT